MRGSAAIGRRYGQSTICSVGWVVPCEVLFESLKIYATGRTASEMNFSRKKSESLK
jgi:hypothetical protein